jgi:preprotein translocase SecE subunit
MARDRKRAKQRQRRRAGAGPAAGPGADREELPASSQPNGDERDGNPDPLDHASADVELAHAAMADPPAADLRADEQPDLRGDEQLGADGAPVESTRAAGLDATGGELPREGNRFANFLRACAAELRRVQWPDRRQVAQATGVVLGFVIIAGAYLGLLDALWSRVVNAIL